MKINSETVYLYGSDLWNNAAKNEALANFYWAPLTFSEDGSINPINCIKSFSLKSKEKTMPDSTLQTQEFKALCDIGGDTQRSQSFTANITGVLKSFSLTTLKSGYPTNDLNLVFYESQDGEIQTDYPLASFAIPQESLGWSAKEIIVNPNIKVSKGKQYILVLKSETNKGCYGFAYNESELNSDEIESISIDNGKNFTQDHKGKLKYHMIID
jgi:hypothetical protein